MFFTYGKCSKISNTLFHPVLALDLLFLQLFLKILSGMSDSVDSDQAAPEEQLDLSLHCLHNAILSDTLVYKI